VHQYAETDAEVQELTAFWRTVLDRLRAGASVALRG
jgi:hypothetical protein